MLLVLMLCLLLLLLKQRLMLLLLLLLHNCYCWCCGCCCYFCSTTWWWWCCWWWWFDYYFCHCCCDICCRCCFCCFYCFHSLSLPPSTTAPTAAAAASTFTASITPASSFCLPHRFLNEDKTLDIPDHFLPYGAGTRQCPGESLAEVEIFLFFATFMHQLQVLPGSPSMTLEGVFDHLLRPKPFQIVVQERD